MTVILLTKAEAAAIAREFKRNNIGGSFSTVPYDDQVYRTKQTGKRLVHYSYEVTGPQLKFIQARARRRSGVLVKSTKYGARRAFPEPRTLQERFIALVGPSEGARFQQQMRRIDGQMARNEMSSASEYRTQEGSRKRSRR